MPPSKLDGKVFNYILIIVNRFTKIVHYLPIIKKIEVKELVDVFRYKIIRLYSVLEVIILD